MKKPTIDETLAAASGKRSEIYEWLWSDFEELKDRLSKHGVNWPGLAALAAEKGLNAGKGKKPTGEIVRQTWARVKADKKKASEPKATKISAPKPTAAPVTETLAEPKPFRPARKKT